MNGKVYTSKVSADCDEVFPLKKIKFEDTEFWAPNNHIKLIEQMYGKDWESIPNNIACNHGRI